MPVVVRAIGCRIDLYRPRCLGAVNMIEEEQFYSGGMLRVDTEVHTIRARCRPEWCTASHCQIVGTVGLPCWSFGCEHRQHAVPRSGLRSKGVTAKARRGFP